MGPPLEHAFRDYYNFNEDKIKKAVTLFREKLQKDGIKLYKAYDGVPELLEELHQRGKTLAIVTSKIDHIAKTALESTKLHQYFEVIGTQQVHKVVQKEVILARVLKELNVKSETSVVMVGDRMHDVEPANKHNIDSIGVLWGYGSESELREEGSTYIAHNTQELKSFIG